MHHLDKPLRGNFDAHMALCATANAREAEAAHVSKVFTRHGVQRLVPQERKSVVPLVLTTFVLAASIGALLSFGV